MAHLALTTARALIDRIGRQRSRSASLASVCRMIELASLLGRLAAVMEIPLPGRSRKNRQPEDLSRWATDATEALQRIYGGDDSTAPREPKI